MVVWLLGRGAAIQCVPTQSVGTRLEASVGTRLVRKVMRKTGRFKRMPCAVGQAGKPDVRGRRRGVATLDYVLVLGVILPLAAFLFRVGPTIIRLAYEMVCVIVSWPFM